jgi:hypothetical protein
MMAGSAASTAWADVAVFPAAAHAAFNFIPFGTVSTTQHQVFASTLFSAVSGGAPVTISDLGFAAGAVGTLNTNVTIRMGYTTRAPE